MNKQLKTLDDELKKTGMIRLNDPTPKIDHSLFRAIAIAVYGYAGATEQVKSILRLTLSCNVKYYRKLKEEGLVPDCNPFASIPLSCGFIQKYIQNNQYFLDYWNHPQLQCFYRDNLEIAAFVFNRSVSVYSIHASYLNQLIISPPFQSRRKPIALARICNRFFCVQKKTARIIDSYLREYILNRIISKIVMEHYSDDSIQQPYDSTKPQKQHKKYKKSQSDCGDLSQKLDDLTKNKTDYYKYSNDVGFDNTNKFYDPYFMAYTNTYCTGSIANSVGSITEGTAINQINMNYEFQCRLVSNKRYQGRLKFFKQEDNYGFIIADHFGTNVFVHYDDLSKTGLTKTELLNAKGINEIRFEFTYHEYKGRQEQIKNKAIDLKIIGK